MQLKARILIFVNELVVAASVACRQQTIAHGSHASRAGWQPLVRSSIKFGYLYRIRRGA